MISTSACRHWQPDRAANPAQQRRSYTTARDTIIGLSVALADWRIVSIRPFPDAGTPELRDAAAGRFAAFQDRRIAQAGRLGIPVESAVRLVHAAGVGTVATLLATSDEERDPQLADLTREAVMAAIVADLPKQRDHIGIASLAIALGARLGDTESITPGGAPVAL